MRDVYKYSAGFATILSRLLLLQLCAEPPVVTNLQFSREGHLIRGEDVDIECTVSGVPTPTVTWEKDGTGLSSTPELFIGQTTMLNDSVFSFLRITNIDTSDDGSYSCTGSNRVGDNTSTIELGVSGMYTFLEVTLFNYYQMYIFILRSAFSY